MSAVRCVMKRTWADVIVDLRPIYEWALVLKPTLIIAVTRGGMIPAAILAGWLDVRKIDVVSMEGYGADDIPLESLIIHKFPGAICYQQSEIALIVDDIIDTGRTMQRLARMLPKAKRAALYGKLPATHQDVHCIGRLVPNEAWVTMPWEEPITESAHA